MNAARRAVADSATMLRRDLRHARRYPVMTVSGFLLPVLMLLLFDGVFGRTLRAGLGGALAGGSYVDYLVPGVLVMAAGGVAEATAINTNLDMSGGMMARLRTMAIWRPAVLVGAVAGSLVRTALTVAAVLAVAVALGFPAGARPLDWLAALGVVLLLGLALAWVAVAFGLLAKTPAGANGLSLILLVLPFVSSAFVPPATMPAGVRAFAAHQPFTPVIDTLRTLLAGGPLDGPAGAHALLAVGWCLGIAAAAYLSALALYNRDPRAAP